MSNLTSSNFNSEQQCIIDIKSLIDTTRSRLAVSVNSQLTLLYWSVGTRIKQEILHNNRAEYGKQIVRTLSSQLTQEYGKGWSKRNLDYMLRFAETYTDSSIVQTLCAQLSWSHLKKIIYIDDELKRDFYIQLCQLEHWSTRTLQQKIDSMLYERTAIAKQPDEIIKRELAELKNTKQITADFVFRDPYVLDFLQLENNYSEQDLEASILQELEKFLLELGSDFAFIARQKRISIDNEDYYIDLLFYHRGLNRLIVIELKLGDFKPSYKGQMELYLRWLSKHEKRNNENEPLGIILCADKKQELIELLELDQSGIHVAQYLTQLPAKELLQQRLQVAIESAKNRLAIKQQDIEDE